MLAAVLSALAALAAITRAAPQNTLGNLNFPDPSITFDPQASQWYAFATQGNGKRVQAAAVADFHGPWRILRDVDLLPVVGKWVNQTAPGIWAPDVQYIAGSDTFVLYYSGRLPGTHLHCIGVATSPNITGPFAPHDEPWACPIEEGGAIDASGHRDEADGSRWVVYKVDGNALGRGGPCGNGDPPGRPTPLRLQRVEEGDGITPVGEAVTILDRDPELDGPLIEAPNIVKGARTEGGFVLFYSSHCWNTPEYDVKYATAENINGPYTRKGQLMGSASEDFGLEGPGGATSIPGGGALLFHARCSGRRCMYQTDYVMEGGNITITP